MQLHISLSKFLLAFTILLINACGGEKTTNPPPIEVETTETAPEIPSTKDSTTLLPDLVITDIKIDPSPTVSADGRRFLIRGQTYSFEVQVRNAGSGPVNGAVAIDVSYGCPGHGRSGDLIYISNDLQSNKSSYSQPYKVKIKTDNGGKCSIEFKVDRGNVHKEVDDSPASNVQLLSFEVP